MLQVPHRALVVVAGIPGAGKSVLLRHWTMASPSTVVLDPEQVRARLPAQVLYGLVRPLVHLAHWMRIARATTGRADLVVAHAPATSAAHRALLTRWARRAGRPTVLIVLDVTAAQARRGQLARGRVVREGPWPGTSNAGPSFGAGPWPRNIPGFGVVRLLGRSAADRLTAIRVGPDVTPGTGTPEGT